MNPVHARILAGLLALWLFPVLAAPVEAAPGDHKYVSLRGHVVDAAGAALADVRVEAAGTREAIALTNGDGRFAMTLDLGSMLELRLHPVYVSLRARRAGYRLRMAGGAPELAFEVRLGEEDGTPVMQARSNFGLITDALLGALAPPGDRTASLQLRFIGEPGADGDSSAVVPETRRSAPLAEPWLVTPPPMSSVKPAPVERARPVTPVEQAAATPPIMMIPVAPRGGQDSLRLARQSEQRATIAAAQAKRDSVWRAQRVQAQARKAVTDSARVVREAAEDSMRRARFGLPPRPALIATGTPLHSENTAAAESPKTPKSARPARPKPARPDPAQAAVDAPPSLEVTPMSPPIRVPAPRPSAPSTGVPTTVSGLQRIEPRTGSSRSGDSEPDERGRLEADTCGCRVRGTVELEFTRLLTSPMRVEVAIRELPALRDTIELFMGSPRAFEMRRVPCGRWSLVLRPFSERSFGVVTPEEVAPFDCRQRGLRQVRIVIAPVRAGR